ncbi:MAG: DUF899 domain-containing protein [Verrucomicrobia bacterium]|nr:DUF899 domain-containing protein [Verrucomicrobiota bacterium]
MTTNTLEPRRIVSNDEWLEHRLKLLQKEKELTRLRDQLAAERRDLPLVKVEKSYAFDGPSGKETLKDLFGDKSQLIIYHFMFGPEWQEGCPICSMAMDNVGGSLIHLEQRDVAFAVVSRATLAQIELFKRRMGWTFKWVSSNSNDFNWDFHVSVSEQEKKSGLFYFNYKEQKYPEQWPTDEAPGFSVFYKDSAGTIYYTYSTYARGGEFILGAYNFLDLVPKGRNEEGLPWPMAWVRYHDRYDQPSPKPN